MREDLHPKAVSRERRLDEVRIWSGKHVWQWRAVVVSSDSITGIPETTSLIGDTSRVRLPLSAVDSIQVGYQSHVEGADIADYIGGGAFFILIVIYSMAVTRK